MSTYCLLLELMLVLFKLINYAKTGKDLINVKTT